MDNFASYRLPKRPSSRKKRQESILFLSLGVFLSLICASIAGLALYLSGYHPFVFSFNLTATAISQRHASCQVLINRAIQASGNYCGGTGSNHACYGNAKIQAELASDATHRFSEPGDTVAFAEIHRLTASPLNLENNNWGIAVFKVMANLPRSLPGETVTMIVFGNTTLDNQSGNLESFYFFSEFGQITCEAVPFDGLVINVPDGSGVRMHVNGAELTLMGTASLKAAKGKEMEVSLLSGSGRIVSNGQEQYFGAGQKVQVGLGGENGVQSISAPSAPEPITQAELNTACNMTGQYCSQSALTPVSEIQAQQQLESAITFTPTAILSRTPTTTPTPSVTPTNTSFVLPSWTPPWTITPTRTRTPVPPTATRTRTITPSPTTFVLPSSTPNGVQTAFAQTMTAAAAQTSVALTAIASVPTDPSCGGAASLLNLAVNNDQLTMDIANNDVQPITINRVFANWVKSPSSQKLSLLFLNGNQVWNISDNDPPSDIPSEGAFANGAILTIPATSTQSFVIQFLNPLASGNYDVHIVFDIGCQVTGSQAVP